jgi:predicted negative regulator of RcsB-dependent stress response
MAVYDLEEQEQLDDLKAWWKRWGNLVSGIVIAVCVAIVGVQGWRWWKHSQAEQASVLYGAVVAGSRANDVAKAKDAQAQLQFALDRSDEDDLKQIARFRLAEVLFDQKKNDEALRLLDAKHDEPFAGIYADLTGDILAASGRKAEARTAYQTALAKLDSKSPYRSYVQVKLDSLGGPVAAPGGGAPGPAPAAAPAAPGAAAPAAPKQ